MSKELKKYLEDMVEVATACNEIMEIQIVEMQECYVVSISGVPPLDDEEIEQFNTINEAFIHVRNVLRNAIKQNTEWEEDAGAQRAVAEMYGEDETCGDEDSE